MKPPDKREVRENYGELGGGLYDLRYEDEQSRKYDAAFLLTLPKEDDLLLDNGCGTGMFLRRLDSPCVGLDLTAGLISAARQKLKFNHHLVQGDSEHLPFRGGVFQGIYAITLIQNLPDKELAVSEMRRVSRTQATLFITALKAAFNREYLAGLLERKGFSKVDLVGDAGTNDWIAFAQA
jgi:ubiquinone/menaquinone biosynthesis C-methylase UbiE